jgi:cytochrome c oxidase assembly factor CtaG
VSIGRKMQKLFQVIAWLLALAIIVLSLGSPSIRPITAAGHGLEHLLMFLATGVAFALGYPRRFWLQHCSHSRQRSRLRKFGFPVATRA